jgi:chromate reductase
MHILGLCGSLREHSYNRRLLAAAAQELPDDAVFLAFEELDKIPPYNEDIDARETPVAVRALRGAIAAASGILITTPEYNASVPGLLKNAIDWASRPYPDHVLRGKPVVVASASISPYGATLAQAELRRVLKVVGAHVLEAELAVAEAHNAFAADGRLADAELRLELASLVQALVARVSTESSRDWALRTVQRSD